MSFNDFEDFEDHSVMRKSIREQLEDYEDELAGREDLIESQFRLTNSKENKRYNDAKLNKANKWKVRG